MRRWLRSMSVYTVHEPPPRTDETAADPARFMFVRDGFHFWAFVLGPVWMLWRRLWLVLLLYVVVLAVLNGGLWLVDAASDTTFFVWLLVAILVGLEAPTLRRWTFHRRGWATVGVVAADDAETAERRFYESWARRTSRPNWQPPAPSGSFHAPAPQEPAVIGLFPEPGVRQ